MAIKNKEVSHKLPEYSSICHLMKSAFPQNEQFPLWLLHLLALRKNVNFRAFFDEDQFCGVIYTVESSIYIFVLYLAVNDKIRSKGYGSQILQWLKQSTSKTIVLNVEAINGNAANSKQREKRVEFYQKNGITDTGYFFTDKDEKYSVLSSDSEHFSIAEYNSLLERFSLGSFKVNFSKR